jgi:uncharacterized protein
MSYEINYPKMIDDALHEVVRGVLRMVAKDGLKEGHHFFISFITNAPGVELSKSVKDKYPDEITIVVQYQFDELKVFDKHFTIRLSFDGVEEQVLIPYKAMTAFSDPLEKISFQFHYYQEQAVAKGLFESVAKETKGNDPVEVFSSEDAVESSNVIQLDKFRSSSDKK